jgi:hypothetical protein
LHQHITRTAVAVITAAALLGSPALSGSVNADGHAQPDSFAADKRVRADFGLQRDDEHISSIHADESRPGSGVSRTFGIPMQAREVAEIRQRERVASDDSKIIRAYFANRPGDFSGLYIDNNTGKLTAAVTSGVEQHKSALRALVRHPDRLALTLADHSMDDLEAALAVLTGRLDDYVQDGVRVGSVFIAEAENTIRVTVSTDVDDARARLGADVDVDVLDVRFGEAVQLDGTPYRNSPPFRGGQRIVRQGVTGTDCTSGFVGYRNSIPTGYFLLTASHCAQLNTCWSQGPQNDNIFIGCTQATTWPTGPSPGRGADVGRINIDTPSYRSNDYVSNCCPEAYRDVLAWADTNETIGAPACQYGSVTIVSCGTLQTKTGVLTGTLHGTYFRFYNMRGATYIRQPGDSGASVTNGGGLAMGLHSGTDGTTNFYSNISAYERSRRARTRHELTAAGQIGTSALARGAYLASGTFLDAQALLGAGCQEPTAKGSRNSYEG